MSVQFELVGKQLRSVYPQFGGGTILGDECRCQVQWLSHKVSRPNFAVVRSIDCPIDEHKQEALNRQQSEISTGDAQRCKTPA